MIQLQKFTFNPFQENTYIVWDNETLETIVIDPGCSNSSEEDEIIKFVEENSLKIKYLINTHCHIDHVLGNSLIKEKYDCKFYAPELDIPLLQNVVEQAQLFGMSIKPSPLPDILISEDLILSIGEINMSFIFTPGHTPGEYCILFNDEKVLISGDVLFLEGIGRTDLWGGDYDTLLQSIKSKLLVLSDDYLVYPGHGDKTTIGYEKNNNPFLI